ncbi:hypothetical protein HMI56_006928 [Coelomomyces lativittatus]|nr:hypothetical protein HMI56_006928 [Coelomomyces lativittatus]
MELSIEYRQKLNSLNSLRNDTSKRFQTKKNQIAMEIKNQALAGLSEMDPMESVSSILRQISKSDAQSPFFIVHPYFPIHWQDYECHENIKLPLIEHMDKVDRQLDLDFLSLEPLSSESISDMDEFRVGYLFDLYQTHVSDAQREFYLIQRLTLQYPRKKAIKILEQVHANRKRAHQKTSLIQGFNKLSRIQNALEVMRISNQMEATKLNHQLQMDQVSKEAKVVNEKINEWRERCKEKEQQEALLREKQLELEREISKKKEGRLEMKKKRFYEMKEKKSIALEIERAKEHHLLEQLAREAKENLKKERLFRLEKINIRKEMSVDRQNFLNWKRENAEKDQKRNEIKLLRFYEKIRENLQVHRDPERFQKPTLASTHRQNEKNLSSNFLTITGYSDESIFCDQRFKLLDSLKDHQFSSETRAYLNEVLSNLRPCKPYSNEWKSQFELGTVKE